MISETTGVAGEKSLWETHLERRPRSPTATVSLSINRMTIRGGSLLAASRHKGERKVKSAAEAVAQGHTSCTGCYKDLPQR